MTSSIQILRSTNAQDRPFPGNLLEGQPAVNLNSGEPGLFFKASDGTIFKIGPAAITSDGNPPNASATGQTGNAIGEFWLDQSMSPAALKIYDGSTWIDVTQSVSLPLGTSDIQNDAITNAKLANSAVGSNELANDAVIASKIAASAVEESKIQSGAVTNSKLGAAAVTGDKIATGTITSTNITNGTIVNEDVSASAAIVSSKLSYIGTSPSPTGFVARTAQSKMLDVVSVKDFGAVGDGVVDDTAAIQAAFTWFANQQNLGIPSIYGQIFFPQGIYKITAPINIYGYVSITGVGTGYIAGSVIRQYTADTDIFRFYANQIDNLGLGVNVEGLIFEHFPSTGSYTGAALKFPRINPATGLPMNSNSHYIRNCRYGALYPYGRFFDGESVGDVEISGCCIDVCRGNEAIKFGRSSAANIRSSGIRITNNIFFACKTAIHIANAVSVIVADNLFSSQDIPGGYAIKLAGDGTGSSGFVSGISITDNVFETPRRILLADSTSINVLYDSNLHYLCTDYPMVVTGSGVLYGYKITNNFYSLANGVVLAGSPETYSNPNAVIQFDGTAQLADGEFCDNRVNVSQLNITEFFNESPTGSFFGSGMTIRNNVIWNHPSTFVGGTISTYVPTDARELEIECFKNTLGALPTNEEIFLFDTYSFTNSINSIVFDIEYNVYCLYTAKTATRTGKVSVAITNGNLTLSSIQSSIASIVSTAADSGNVGGIELPTVTFSVRKTPIPAILLTVTWSEAGGDCVVFCKATSVYAGAAGPAIKAVP